RVHVGRDLRASERELERADAQVGLRVDLDLDVPREAAAVHHGAVGRSEIDVAHLVLVEAHDRVPLGDERLVERELVELVAPDADRRAGVGRVLGLAGLRVRDADEQRKHVDFPSWGPTRGEGPSEASHPRMGPSGGASAQSGLSHHRAWARVALAHATSMSTRHSPLGAMLTSMPVGSSSAAIFSSRPWAIIGVRVLRRMWSTLRAPVSASVQRAARSSTSSSWKIVSMPCESMMRLASFLSLRRAMSFIVSGSIGR